MKEGILCLLSKWISDYVCVDRINKLVESTFSNIQCNWQ